MKKRSGFLTALEAVEEMVSEISKEHRSLIFLIYKSLGEINSNISNIFKAIQLARELEKKSERLAFLEMVKSSLSDINEHLNRIEVFKKDLLQECLRRLHDRTSKAIRKTNKEIIKAKLRSRG